jgi:hypothetical protein
MIDVWRWRCREVRLLSARCNGCTRHAAFTAQIRCLQSQDASCQVSAQHQQVNPRWRQSKRPHVIILEMITLCGGAGAFSTQLTCSLDSNALLSRSARIGTHARHSTWEFIHERRIYLTATFSGLRVLHRPCNTPHSCALHRPMCAKSKVVSWDNSVRNLVQ